MQENEIFMHTNYFSMHKDYISMHRNENFCARYGEDSFVLIREINRKRAPTGGILGYFITIPNEVST